MQDWKPKDEQKPRSFYCPSCLEEPGDNPNVDYVVRYCAVHAAEFNQNRPSRQPGRKPKK